MLCTMLASTLAGCRSGEATPERRALIDSRDWYDPRSLDPAKATDVPSGRAVAYLFDGLTKFTPAGQVQPSIARPASPMLA
jgi:peptide/nickel transport system substrate-binding protein/oligopeptide transport system substrate-binding protein